MKRLLLLLALLIAGSANADWVAIGETDNTTFYIDPTTIRKDGNLRKVWEIQDLKTRHKDGGMSRRVMLEFDCKAERYRALANSTHTGPMASGQTIHVGDYERYPDSWSEIPPKTAAEFILKMVCAK